MESYRTWTPYQLIFIFWNVLHTQPVETHQYKTNAYFHSFTTKLTFKLQENIRHDEPIRSGNVTQVQMEDFPLFSDSALFFH